MYEDDATRLRHMLDAARDAQTFMRGRGRDDLERDRQLTYAVVRCLEIVGEAASKITPRRRDEITEIAWPRMIGMRHRLAHDYIVWDTLANDVPRLIHALARIVPR